MSRSTTRAIAMAALLSAVAVPAAAQAIPSGRGFELLLSGGPSQASRSVDAMGWFAEAGIARRLSSRVGVRLELAGHRYGAVPVYQCIVQDAERCYQTLGRDVIAGIANVVVQPMTARESGTYRGLYLIGGLGTYDSRRKATAYPDCEPSGECSDRDVRTMTLRDTQLGINGGIGFNVILGGSPVFTEMRLHYARPNSPANGPTNDYFLFPISIGFKL